MQAAEHRPDHRAALALVALRVLHEALLQRARLAPEHLPRQRAVQAAGQAAGPRAQAQRVRVALQQRAVAARVEEVVVVGAQRQRRHGRGVGGDEGGGLVLVRLLQPLLDGLVGRGAERREGGAGVEHARVGDRRGERAYLREHVRERVVLRVLLARGLGVAEQADDLRREGVAEGRHHALLLRGVAVRAEDVGVAAHAAVVGCGRDGRLTARAEEGGAARGQERRGALAGDEVVVGVVVEGLGGEDARRQAGAVRQRGKRAQEGAEGALGLALQPRVDHAAQLLRRGADRLPPARVVHRSRQHVGGPAPVHDVQHVVALRRVLRHVRLHEVHARQVAQHVAHELLRQPLARHVLERGRQQLQQAQRQVHHQPVAAHAAERVGAPRAVRVHQQRQQAQHVVARLVRGRQEAPQDGALRGVHAAHGGALQAQQLRRVLLRERVGEELQAVLQPEGRGHRQVREEVRQEGRLLQRDAVRVLLRQERTNLRHAEGQTRRQHAEVSIELVRRHGPVEKRAMQKEGRLL